MTLSLSEISTVGASFDEDVRAYAAAGFDGIGIWEMKLGDDEAALEALRASGLRVTNCVPEVPSILPNAVIDGPDDVEERVASMRASLHRLAAYEPDCVLCLTGPTGGRDEEEARSLVVDGLRRLAAAADDAGVRLGLEPIHASQRDQLTLITTIPETLDLLDEAGLPDVGIMVDLWHLWDTPEIDRHLRENVEPDHRRPRRRLVRRRPRRARPAGRRRRRDRRAAAAYSATPAGTAPGTSRSSGSPTIPRRSGRSTSGEAARRAHAAIAALER